MKKVAALENMIEDKTRSLYLARLAAEKQSDFLTRVLNHMQGVVVTMDLNGVIESVAGNAKATLDRRDDEIIGLPLSKILSAEGLRDDQLHKLQDEAFEGELVRENDADIPVIASVSPMIDGDGVANGYVCLTTDISQRKQLEIELRLAHKLESVGQLAAGMAHEINTPIQFIGDSVLFLGEALTDLLDLATRNREVWKAAAADHELAEFIGRIEEAEAEADVEFLEVEAPAAVQRTVDGVERVGTIVKAMKRFSHPGSDEKTPEDLNEIIGSTLVVAQNEHKYVADVVTNLGELPAVYCLRGDISQVILNIVVNAAHAIADAVEGTSTRGRITINTGPDGDGVLITISDTGGGVPAAIRGRVFDPFFTTKEPGQGTGQGLAISRTIVVDKHQGRLNLAVDEGVGSTFRIWLPLADGETT